MLRRPFILPAVVLLAVTALALQGYRDRNRDEWQRPAEVMDALRLEAGSSVADIGAGWGYFTFHLAQRVGPEGKVYAVDIDEDRLEEIAERAQREDLRQVETIAGAPDDPRLPDASVDAILVVNTYHEFRRPEAMLAGMARALRPGGLLAVIDEDDREDRARSDYHSRHAIADEVVRREAEHAGFRFLRSLPGFDRRGEPWYFLLFEKP